MDFTTMPISEIVVYRRNLQSRITERSKELKDIVSKEYKTLLTAFPKIQLLHLPELLQNNFEIKPNLNEIYLKKWKLFYEGKYFESVK